MARWKTCSPCSPTGACRARRPWAALSVALLLLAAVGGASAQPLPSPPGVPPPFKLLRYDEDYRYLRDPAMRADFWDPAKYVPFGSPGWFVSLGGEIRERFEDYSASNFGVPGPRGDGYLMHRALLHADLHAGESLRAFVQLGNQLAMGKDVTTPPYVDQLDVQQAFVDLRVPLPAPAQDPLLVRVGRQEMAFGAQRLVSIRDAPNVRRAFDGLRLGSSLGSARVDAFATRPVLLKDGSFDDRPNQAQGFWGVYATMPAAFLPATSADLYYLGFENDRALFSDGSGAERRHSLGGRLSGRHGRWDWDWEALFQFGSLASQQIRAWGFSTDTGYTFAASAWHPRAGIKATMGSGDRNPHDGTIGTYNGLFPKLAYFNQAGLIGASNVLDIQPSLTLVPAAGIKLTFACDFIWRATTHDAVYTSAGIPVPGTAGRSGQYSSSQLSVDVAWQASRHVLVNGGAVYVDESRTLKAVGGHNTRFLYLALGYTF